MMVVGRIYVGGSVVNVLVSVSVLMLDLMFVYLSCMFGII